MLDSIEPVFLAFAEMGRGQFCVVEDGFLFVFCCLFIAGGF